MRDPMHAFGGRNAATSLIKVIDANRHDYETAQEMARASGGRFGSMREFLIDASGPEGFQKLRGGSWWMDGQFWKQIGYYEVDTDKGAVTRVRESLWRALPRERRAVFTGGRGPGPAAIVIHDDNDSYEYRFEIIQSSIILAGVGIVELPKLRRDGA